MNITKTISIVAGVLSVGATILSKISEERQKKDNDKKTEEMIDKKVNEKIAEMNKQ